VARSGREAKCPESRWEEKGERGQRDLVVIATQVADREGEQGVFLGKELGGTKIKGGSSSGETYTTTSPGEIGVPAEFGRHEQEEGNVKKDKESNNGDVDPQGSQHENEGKNEPGGQKDADSTRVLTRVVRVGGSDTEVGVEEGSVGQPETSVGTEGSRAKGITERKLPHSSQ